MIPFFCVVSTSFHSTESNSAYIFFKSSGFSEIHEQLAGIGLWNVFVFGRNDERFCIKDKVNNLQQQDSFQEDTLGLGVKLVEPRVLRHLGIFHPMLKMPFFVS